MLCCTHLFIDHTEMAYLSHGLDTVDKAQYYVWYLGWRECDAIGGRAHTEPVVKELVSRRRSEDELVKFTIEVNPTELRIVQLIEGKKGKIDRKRHPSVPARDVTYAVQALSPDEDVVACIYLGFNPQTQRVVHVHVYRCDSPDTARRMVAHLNRIIALPEHRARVRGIEEDLVRKEHIVPRPMGLGDSADYADTMVDDDVLTADYSMDNQTPVRNWRRPTPSPTPPPIPPTGTTPGRFASVTDELKARMGNKKAAPILLPVKDYGAWETIGNTVDLENRKCRNVDLVGKKGVGNITDAVGKGKSGTGLVTVISLGEGGEVKVDTGRRKAPVPTPQPKPAATPEVRKESSGGEDSARGDSEIDSNRNSNKSDDANSPLAPPTAFPVFNGDGSHPERIRHSSGFHDFDDDDDVTPAHDDPIQAITPRWKRSQVFVPARPGNASPADLSPDYGSRPFFNGQTPMYQGVDQLSPRSGGALSRHSTHSSGSGGNRRSKYTPSSLGIVPGARDEGYRSMDRGEVPAKYYDQIADVSASMPSLALHDRRYPPGGAIVYSGTGDDVPVDYDEEETIAMRQKSPRRRLPREFDRR